MKKTKRGYKKPEGHDQLEQSVLDISETFEMIDKDMERTLETIGNSNDTGLELLWQNIKNTSEISLMKGVNRYGR